MFCGPVNHLEHQSWSWQPPTAGYMAREIFAVCSDGFSSGHFPHFTPRSVWDSAFRAKGLCFRHDFNGWTLILDHEFLQNPASSSSFMPDCTEAPGDALPVVPGKLLSCCIVGWEGFLGPHTGLSSCTCPASQSSWLKWGARKASPAPQTFWQVL